MFRTPVIRLQSFFRLVSTSPPHKLGGVTLLYYLFLVLATDCFIWFSAKSLSGYSWQTLLVYSLMSYPLWMFIVLKGIGKEQSDLSEMGRWHTVDLLPCGATMLFLGHHLGKLLKIKAFQLWVIVFIVGALINRASEVEIMLALLNILIGSINIVIAGVVARYYAPKGYSQVVSSIFFNLTWIFSGAVFPLGMLSDSTMFYLFNPFAAAISTPLSLLQTEGTLSLSSVDVQLYTLCGGVLWLAMFATISKRAERSQREKFYQ